MAQKQILPPNIRVDRNCQPTWVTQNAIPEQQELILLAAPPTDTGLSVWNWNQEPVHLHYNLGRIHLLDILHLHQDSRKLLTVVSVSVSSLCLYPDARKRVGVNNTDIKPDLNLFLMCIELFHKMFCYGRFSI